MNFKFLNILFVLLLSFAYKSFSSSESLLEEDIALLTDTGKKVNDAQLYNITDEKFDELFPYQYLTQSSDISFSVGQIVNQNDEGRGTGFLYDVEEKDNELIATCITSFHVFCYVGKNENQPLIIGKNFRFFLNRKTLHSDKGLNMNSGIVEINKVLFYMDESNVISGIKDVCVFQGVLKKGGLDFLSNDEYLENIRKHKFTILDGKINIENKTCTIFHYPDGKKEMRINRGELKEDGVYKVRTLEGSSGAPLLSGDKIIGIHTGGIEKRKDIIAQRPLSGIWGIMYENQNYYHFAREGSHAYESFLLKDLDNLLKGIDVYNLIQEQRIILHIKLLNAKIKNKIPNLLEEEVPKEDLPDDVIKNLE